MKFYLSREAREFVSSLKILKTTLVFPAILMFGIFYFLFTFVIALAG